MRDFRFALLFFIWLVRVSERLGPNRLDAEVM